MPKPLTYTPSSKIRTGYTPGGEFLTLNSRTEYIGYYHIYPNGAVYSGFSYSPTSSEELISLSNSQFTDSNVRAYVTQKKLLVNNYIKPIPVSVKPSTEDLRLGYMNRYIIQKINEPAIIFEIDKKQAQTINTNNRRGIDGNLYRIAKLEWSINGPRESVIASNRRVLSINEITFPGIKKYLSDPEEFYNV